MAERKTRTLATFNISFTPEQKAELEILGLMTDPRFMGNYVIGGHTPPSMIRKNKKLAELHKQEENRILAKHGLIDKGVQDYLAQIKACNESIRKYECEKKKLRQQLRHLRSLSKSNIKV